MPDDPIRRLLDQLDLEQKVGLLTGDTFWSLPAEPAVGLRRLVLSDGPAGVRGETFDERDPSLSLPSGTALAASWDVGLARRYGAALGAEARRQGVDLVLGPTINLHRTPFGGRHFEAFSEDPLLTGALAVGYVAGVQMAGWVGGRPRRPRPRHGDRAAGPARFRAPGRIRVGGRARAFTVHVGTSEADLPLTATVAQP